MDYNETDREELLRQLEAMTDDEIDCSDIPPITDFSRFRPARIHFLHNSERAYRMRQEKNAEFKKLKN